MPGIIDDQQCSFCDKGQDDVRKLIASPIGSGVYVCDECVELCNDILAALYESEEEEEFTETSNPSSLHRTSQTLSTNSNLERNSNLKKKVRFMAMHSHPLEKIFKT